MLVVLGVLVIGLAAAATIARLAVTSALANDADNDELVLFELESAAHERVLAWLEEESNQVSLPPDTPSPMLVIADDAFEIDGRRVTVTVTAFDQCGMLPWAWIQRDEALPFPREVLDGLRIIELDERPAGLDLMVGAGAADPFPMSGTAEDRAVRLGDRLATHNAGGSINIATAPAWLLEHVENRVGVSLTSGIADARSANELPDPLGVFGDGTAAVRLTNRSDAWGFRIDLGVGQVRRSWWSIYSHDRRGWERRQRIVVR